MSRQENNIRMEKNHKIKEGKRTKCDTESAAACNVT